MKTKWWVGLAAVVLLAGCIPSLHPWFMDKDVTFEEKLLGAWGGEDGKGQWIFEKGQDKDPAYRVTIYDDKEVSILKGTLFKVDGKYYLDTCPVEETLNNLGDFTRMHFLPGHQLFRFDTIEPTIQYRILKPDTITNLLKEKPDLLAHEPVGDSEVALLTAPSEKMRKFLAEHANDEDFFGDSTTLKRLNPLFTEKDFSFEPKLVGRWIDDDGTICISEAVNNQSYRIIGIHFDPEGMEVHHYSAAVVTINNRRFVAVYEGGRPIAVSGGSDADRTPDLLLWIEQTEPTPQYRVIEYAQAAEILKTNDEQFKTAVEKLPKVRWTKLVEEKRSN